MTRSEISFASVSNDDQTTLPTVSDKLSDQEKQDKEKSVPSPDYKHKSNLPARYPDMAWLGYSVLWVTVYGACSIVLLT